MLSGKTWRLTHCLPGEFSPVTGINPGVVGESRGPDWAGAIHVSARYDTVAWANEESFQAELWGHNATTAHLRGTLTTTLMAVSGEQLAVQTETVSLEADSMQRWDTITLARDRLPELFLLVSMLQNDDCPSFSNSVLLDL